MTFSKKKKVFAIKHMKAKYLEGFQEETHRRKIQYKESIYTAYCYTSVYIFYHDVYKQ